MRDGKRNHLAITRRDFLRGTAGATLLGAGFAASAQEATPAAKSLEAAASARTRVVLVRDAAVLDGDGNLDPTVIERMLDDGVKALLGESDVTSCWKRLVSAEDTVGIKTNVWRFLRTPPPLEQAVLTRIKRAGVSEERIGVDDRGVRTNPLFHRATALINMRPMRTHHWAGVGSCLKNYIPFSESPPNWHDDSCANLAGLWDLPMVKGKTRLNILVMLTPLFHGKGPHHFNADYLWPYKGLIVGADPVAVDATGLRILTAKRLTVFGEERAYLVPPKHIQVAQDKFALGIADPARIDVVKLGWDEAILI